MSDELCTFWLVWRLNGGSPTYNHNSRESADKEAKRLSQQNPGEVFVVLKSATAFHCEVKPASKFKMIAPAKDEPRRYMWDDPDDEVPF